MVSPAFVLIMKIGMEIAMNLVIWVETQKYLYIINHFVKEKKSQTPNLLLFLEISTQ